MIVGVFLFSISQSIDQLLEEKQVTTLAGLFFVVHFLIATQVTSCIQPNFSVGFRTFVLMAGP